MWTDSVAKMVESVRKIPSSYWETLFRTTRRVRAAAVFRRALALGVLDFAAAEEQADVIDRCDWVLYGLPGLVGVRG